MIVLSTRRMVDVVRHRLRFPVKRSIAHQTPVPGRPGPLAPIWRSNLRRSTAGLAVFWMLLIGGAGVTLGEEELLTLDEHLLREDAAELAHEARQHGDPRRGAILFHQPHTTCTQCHATGHDQNPLGPDLARLEDDVTGQQLVEAVLTPSKRIRQGYEPLVLLLDDGRTLTGLLVERRSDALVIRDVEQNGAIREIPKDIIEQQTVSQQSIMPAGLANLVGGRREFLDLVAYLIEISEHGPARALALAPPPRAPDTSRSQPRVYRTIMPESGPASLAIGLGDDLWACFDPQRGGINYVWAGSLDLAPTVAQKINDPAKIEGRLFYREIVDRPLRPEDPDRLPSLQFRGYRFVDGGVEVRYQVDELLVNEQLTLLPEGQGLARDIEIQGPVEQVWIVGEEQASADVDVRPAVREEGAWRIDVDGSRAAVRMSIRPKKVEETGQ